MQIQLRPFRSVCLTWSICRRSQKESSGDTLNEGVWLNIGDRKVERADAGCGFASARVGKIRVWDRRVNKSNGFMKKKKKSRPLIL